MQGNISSIVFYYVCFCTTWSFGYKFEFTKICSSIPLKCKICIISTITFYLNTITTISINI